MKKLLFTLFLAAGVSLAYAQQTPPRPKLPPRPAGAPRGEMPPAPEPPPTPKELWQKIKKGKKQLDAKREQDLREIERTAPRR